MSEYTWGTDGGLKSCDHILFSEVDNSENANGAQIGNGDAEFVFTGKQTLKKGTYLLKGWVYIANGAELTIEPGTVIKGDKQTKASLDKVAYVGAFNATDNWLTGWTNFDPQNTKY